VTQPDIIEFATKRCDQQRRFGQGSNVEKQTLLHLLFGLSPKLVQRAMFNLADGNKTSRYFVASGFDINEQWLMDIHTLHRF